MIVGLVGLGKMGSNLALNMLKKGYQVIGYDANLDTYNSVIESGGRIVKSVAEMVSKLPKPRYIWLMVPAGDVVDKLVDELSTLLSAGDVIIDGGNSFYQDSQRRAKKLRQLEIGFIDLGTSGGTEGAMNGACLMAGGDREFVSQLEPLFLDLTVPGGYLYCGPEGAGHFVKMVHNGIEYGIMQAIGEGFEVMEKSEFDLNLPDIAHLFCNGSVIRGWLMELTKEALKQDPHLERVKGVVQSSGEGKWTVETAIRLGVPVPVIAQSLFVRYASVQEDSFSGKVVASLRNQFGGHTIQKK